MGHRKFNVKFSIKGQIIVAVLLILVCSFFATMVTYIGIAVSMHPTNQAERSATQVEKYVSLQGTKVFSPAANARMQQLVKAGGVEYVVLDAKARPIYGTLLENTVTTTADMIRQLNVTSVQSEGFIFGTTASKAIPIVAKDGTLKGAVYLRWQIFPAGIRSPYTWARILTIGFLFSPFIYMTLFTYIFARRVGRKLNRPLQALIDATHRIQQRDLDFTIDYQGKNEIGKLLAAFEEMRTDLKESLLSQWSLEEERREMLAAISHDLRTPITIIQGHAELLLDAPPENRARLERYLETILRNTNRVVRLMNDFRTVTDIDSAGFSLKPVMVDVEEFFTAKYNEFLVMAKDAGIELSLRFLDDGVNRVSAGLDIDRISQILDNLMANAIRFTKSGGHICWNVRTEEQRISIEIEDDGQGFRTNEEGRVFHKFYQGDKSRSGEKGHSGLGLYIVKALVEKHGGQVEAFNNEHGGATVRFYITPLEN